MAEDKFFALFPEVLVMKTECRHNQLIAARMIMHVARISVGKGEISVSDAETGCLKYLGCGLYDPPGFNMHGGKRVEAVDYGVCSPGCPIAEPPVIGTLFKVASVVDSVVEAEQEAAGLVSVAAKQALFEDFRAAVKTEEKVVAEVLGGEESKAVELDRLDVREVDLDGTQFCVVTGPVEAFGAREVLGIPYCEAQSSEVLWSAECMEVELVGTGGLGDDCHSTFEANRSWFRATVGMPIRKNPRGLPGLERMPFYTRVFCDPRVHAFRAFWLDKPGGALQVSLGVESVRWDKDDVARLSGDVATSGVSPVGCKHIVGENAKLFSLWSYFDAAMRAEFRYDFEGEVVSPRDGEWRKQDEIFRTVCEGALWFRRFVQSFEAVMKVEAVYVAAPFLRTFVWEGKGSAIEKVPWYKRAPPRACAYEW